MSKKQIIFRIDDVGASSKQFEVYSNLFLGNFLFLKYLPTFAAWGPYHELEYTTWVKICEILQKYRAKVTVAITASWVEKDSRLIPFPKKLPSQANILLKGVRSNLIEIANHGLTHCVVGKHLPKLFSSNRKFHREFWDWVAEEIHYKYLAESQKILQDYFGKVVTFVPPGNVWTKDTEKAAFANGLKYLCTKSDLVKTGEKSNGLTYIGDSEALVIHDRDIVKKGISWLKGQLEGFVRQGFEITAVSDFEKGS